jgi:hypothetical protein
MRCARSRRRDTAASEKFDSMADEAMQTAIRVTKEQQSAHSLIKEWGRNFTSSVVDCGKRCGPDGLLARCLLADSYAIRS